MFLNSLKRLFFIKRKNNLFLKEKFQYFMKISGKMFLTDTRAKMSQNIFAYFSISEHSASFLFLREKLFWLTPSPPFTDRSIIFFFTPSLNKKRFVGK